MPCCWMYFLEKTLTRKKKNHWCRKEWLQLAKKKNRTDLYFNIGYKAKAQNVYNDIYIDLATLSVSVSLTFPSSWSKALFASKRDEQELFELPGKMDQSDLKHNLIGLDVGTITFQNVSVHLKMTKLLSPYWGGG